MQKSVVNRESGDITKAEIKRDKFKKDKEAEVYLSCVILEKLGL